MLFWFQSYLENRTQTVAVHGKHSTPASLRYGVPQGSVLAPILLILYIQPLSNVMKHPVVQMQMTHRSTNHADHLKLWTQSTV